MKGLEGQAVVKEEERDTEKDGACRTDQADGCPCKEHDHHHHRSPWGLCCRAWVMSHRSRVYTARDVHADTSRHSQASQ